MPTDRAAHERGSLEAEFATERQRHLHQEVLGEAILFAPPLLPRGRQRLAVIRQVIRDHAVVSRDMRVVEQVAPLAAVGAGGVLEQQRDTFAGLFEVDAVFEAIDGEIDVAAGGSVEARHGVLLSAWLRAAAVRSAAVALDSTGRRP